MKIDFRNLKSFSRSLDRIKKLRDRLSISEKLIDRKLKREIESLYIRPLIAKLRYEPPKRRYPEDYPVNFTSDKQRKFVMANTELPDNRTSRMRKSWKYKWATGEGRLELSLWNSNRNSKYVVGTWGRKYNPDKYENPIQDFHRVTGWKPAHKQIRTTMYRSEAYAKRNARTKFKEILFRDI